jgi:translation elongation factor EF-1beta
MQICGTLKMGSVIIVYDVVPSQNDQAGADVVAEKLKGVTIIGSGPSSKDESVDEQYYCNVGAIEVQDFVFGTKKVVATYEIPDAGGSQDALEQALNEVDGVDTVTFVNAGRPV